MAPDRLTAFNRTEVPAVRFAVRPGQGDPSGFDLGDISVSGDLGTVDSAGHTPDQGMMIYLSVTQLLDSLGDFLRTDARTLAFTGVDTSFGLVFRRTREGLSGGPSRHGLQCRPRVVPPSDLPRPARPSEIPKGREMDPIDDPDIQEWSRAAGLEVDYLDYLSQRADLSLWIGMARVFLPRFVEVEGCVLWDRSYDPENFRAWQDRLDDDTASIEATLNQFRLWLYIDIDGTPVAEANAQALAEEIATSWREALTRAFPDRRFLVRASKTEDGPVVSFVSVL